MCWADNFGIDLQESEKRSVAAGVVTRITNIPEPYLKDDKGFYTSTSFGVINGGSIEILAPDKIRIITGIFRKKDFTVQGAEVKEFIKNCENIRELSGDGIYDYAKDMQRCFEILPKLSEDIKDPKSDLKVSLRETIMVPPRLISLSHNIQKLLEDKHIYPLQA